MRRLAWVLSGALAFGAVAGPAAAQTSKVAAEALFDDAIKLMKEGKYDQACPKLADSQRLDPAANTLLNLAACYEKQGRTASAWETYKEAEAAERDAHKDQYQQLAHDRAAALEPNLLMLTITASVKPVDGTIIKVDGTVVPVSEWGVPVPVDPGQHAIEVSAPNKVTWTSSITVGPGGSASPATLDVPALQDAPTTQAPSTTTPSTASPGTTPTSTTTAAPESPGLGSTRVAALVVGGIGVAGLVAGGVFSLVAASKNSDSKSDCRTNLPDECTAEGVSLRNDARNFGNIASVAVGVGAAAVVGGVVLWLVGAPSSSTQSASLVVAPTPGGAMLRGVF